MRKSIGYGAYDQFGEDVASVESASKLYRGPDPLRFARGSVEIRAKGGNEPSVFKRYTFEAGMTPLGIVLALTSGAGFVYIFYRIFGK